jgi:HTH-type transcriptional regulator / antitoxin HipB
VRSFDDTIFEMRKEPNDLRGQAKRIKTIEEHRRFRPALAMAARVGEQIRKLREARGISQADLGRRAETAQSAIARLQAGTVQPRLDTLNRIAIELGATLNVTIEPLPASNYYRRRGIPKGNPTPPSPHATLKANSEKPATRKLIGHFSADTPSRVIARAIVASRTSKSDAAGGLSDV